MRIQPTLSMAFAMAMGLACGQAHGATPTADTVIGLAPVRAQQTVSSQDTYYLQRIPGTRKARRVYYFNRLDRNGDGGLSRSELPRDMHDLRGHFMQADWDHNGRLSAQEYVMYRQHTVPMYTSITHGMVVKFGPYHADTENLAGL